MGSPSIKTNKKELKKEMKIMLQCSLYGYCLHIAISVWMRSIVQPSSPDLQCLWLPRGKETSCRLCLLCHWALHHTPSAAGLVQCPVRHQPRRLWTRPSYHHGSRSCVVTTNGWETKLIYCNCTHIHTLHQNVQWQFYMFDVYRLFFNLFGFRQLFHPSCHQPRDLLVNIKSQQV